MSKIAFFLTLLIGCQMQAQSLQEYRWKNRVILLCSSEAENADLQAQLEILRAAPSGLAERKLIVIRVFPDQQIIGLSDRTDGINDKKKLYEQYSQPELPFETILIGLDGGEKLRSSLPVSLDNLFAHIDAMPMRQAEMRRKQK